MRKLILLIALGFVVSYYFPDSRQWLKQWTQPIWIPFVKWDTKEQMAQVARGVVRSERLTGELPDRRNWRNWLDYNYSTELKQDPWGSVYQLKVFADSIAIWSYGPDRIPNTEDDFQVSQLRERRRR